MNGSLPTDGKQATHSLSTTGFHSSSCLLLSWVGQNHKLNPKNLCLPHWRGGKLRIDPSFSFPHIPSPAPSQLFTSSTSGSFLVFLYMLFLYFFSYLKKYLSLGSYECDLYIFVNLYVYKSVYRQRSNYTYNILHIYIYYID